MDLWFGWKREAGDLRGLEFDKGFRRVVLEVGDKDLSLHRPNCQGGPIMLKGHRRKGRFIRNGFLNAV